MGAAGPALAPRRSIATTVGRRKRSPWSKLVLAWSPGKGRKGPSTVRIPEQPPLLLPTAPVELG